MDSASNNTGVPSVLNIDGDKYVLVEEKNPIQVNFTTNPEVLQVDGKFDFLKSTRFWAMILGAVSIYLKSKGWIGEEEMTFIATVSSIFVAIKTYDKTVDKFTK